MKEPSIFVFPCNKMHNLPKVSKYYNQDHMMYGSWDMMCNRPNIFVILGNFLPYYPLTVRKMKISKMKKSPGDIIILHKWTKNHLHLETVPRIWRIMDAIVIFILGYTFPFYQQSKKWKFYNNEKKARRYHHFTQVHL